VPGVLPLGKTLQQIPLLTPYSVRLSPCSATKGGGVFTNRPWRKLREKAQEGQKVQKSREKDKTLQGAWLTYKNLYLHIIRRHSCNIMITSWFIAENQANATRKHSTTNNTSRTQELIGTCETATASDHVPGHGSSTQSVPFQETHNHKDSAHPPATVSASGTTNNSMRTLPSLLLTPLQSCTLHGWLNPRRSLHWDDVAKSKDMTLESLLSSGLTAIDLKMIQPDVLAWIKHKQVGLSEVASMVEWPLHPVLHLRANIGDLATMHFPPALLRRLGITYEFMRSQMRMDDDWMKIMHYGPGEWANIGFGRSQAVAMGRKRVEWVFEPMEFDALVMAVSSADPSTSSEECYAGGF